MTAYAYDARGWLTGEVDDNTPRSTPIAPPDHAQEPEAGEPWPRWYRFEWRTEAYVPPDAPTVPDQVERWRAHWVLIAAGKMAAVKAAIAAIPDDVQRELAEVAFYQRPYIRRLGSLTQQLQAAAGISNAERDALFVQAEALEP